VGQGLTKVNFNARNIRGYNIHNRMKVQGLHINKISSISMIQQNGLQSQTNLNTLQNHSALPQMQKVGQSKILQEQIYKF
jgi:hypothetical protein